MKRYQYSPTNRTVPEMIDVWRQADRRITAQDNAIRSALAVRCCTDCVLPVNHDGKHMRQDGVRFSN